jgi:hypothetical protein
MESFGISRDAENLRDALTLLTCFLCSALIIALAL